MDQIVYTVTYHDPDTGNELVSDFVGGNVVVYHKYIDAEQCAARFKTALKEDRRDRVYVKKFMLKELEG